MVIELTEEQKQVVHHPLGKHARVMAVAGSGKTTTMVYRIQYLIREKGVAPNDICILMFNRRAREDFQRKLETVLNNSEKPLVYTFHSYAYSLIGDAITKGYLPPINDFWVDGREERYRDFIHKAMQNLEKKSVISFDSFDTDEVKDCISLWKGSLIPPEFAGHRTKPDIVKIYAEFERLRILQNAASYDDFVPLSIGILKSEKIIQNRENRYKILIVDEYQDINYGQQRLIELLVGNNADIMLVGDDDQTIYEWRGARPEYILDLYKQTFKTKPFIDYTLSYSFRFGPVIAQCAENLIYLNKNRAKKTVISFHQNRFSNIILSSELGEKNTDTNKQLAMQVPLLVRECEDPKKVIVLARTFSQLSGLEIEFLNQHIPYRVIGREPFFKRREIAALTDYLAVVLRLHEILTPDDVAQIRSILNIPNRKLPKKHVLTVLESMMRQGKSVQDAFSYLVTENKSPLSYSQIEKMQELFSVLKRLHEISSSTNPPPAAQLLENIINWTDYYSHFDNYYGIGEASEDRKRIIKKFLEYSSTFILPANEFLTHINRLDSTLGVPQDHQIIMTTVHRVKGEEYDYVIIPACQQGNMPCEILPNNPIFDKSGRVKEPKSSDPIENERRLFYVAITRAKKSVLIGIPSVNTGDHSQSTTPQVSQFIEEMNLCPTQEIFHEFHQVMKNPQYDRKNLEKNLINHAGHKNLINNVLLNYLTKNNISLSLETIKKIESIPISPPQSIHKTNTLKERKRDVEPKWWAD